MVLKVIQWFGEEQLFFFSHLGIFFVNPEFNVLFYFVNGEHISHLSIFNTKRLLIIQCSLVFLYLSVTSSYHGPAGAFFHQPNVIDFAQQEPQEPWYNMLSLLPGKRATNIFDLGKWMAKRNEENIFKPSYGFGELVHPFHQVMNNLSFIMMTITGICIVLM